MDEKPAKSVKQPDRDPVVACRVTEEFRCELDASRDLFPDPTTPTGRASRSGVMRVLMQQALPMLDRANILAVRAIAKRDDTEASEAWRKVIVAGIATEGKGRSNAKTM